GSPSTIRSGCARPGSTRAGRAGQSRAPQPRACPALARSEWPWPSRDLWATGPGFPVVPYPVGIADADLGHPILLGDRAGYLAVEGGVELALHVELGEADARGLNAVGTDHNIGIAEANVSV